MSDQMPDPGHLADHQLSAAAAILGRAIRHPERHIALIVEMDHVRHRWAVREVFNTTEVTASHE